MEFLKSLDLELLNAIHIGLHNKIFDIVMPFMTFLGDKGLIWLIVCIILIISKKFRKEGIVLLIALMVTTLVGEGIIKHIIKRPRPFITMPDIKLLINRPSSYSFPSGHATSSFTAATVLGYYFKKYKIFFYSIATLIAFSRVYLYVHYPSDVITGAVLGTLIAWLVLNVVNKRKVDKNEKNQ